MLGEASGCPRVGALEGFLLVGTRVKQARELIKREHDVGAELVLDSHRHLGVEAMLRTVDVAGEDHAIVVDDRVRSLDGLHLDLWVGRVCLTGELLRQNLLKAGSKRQNLEAARIGVGGTRPVHELTETAGLVDDVGPRLQVQVVGVRKDGLSTQRAHHLGRQGLDVGLRADGNERGGRDRSMRGVDDAGASEASVGFHSVPDGEASIGMVRSLRGRCLERRELLGRGSGQPVVVHRSKTSSFLSPSVRRMAAMTG